jgi:thiol-disulfide isomerase/thioredoxin
MQCNQPKLKKLLLLSVLGAAICQNTFAGLKTGDTFPDLAPFKLEGKLPDTLKGKVVIVDFWASWCVPCKDSFPVMNELIKKYADRGLVIIAVNADEVRADMDAFLKKNPAAFTVVRDATQRLVEKADVDTMPSSFILDREGKVRYLHNGFHGEKTKKEYVAEIEALLAR